MLTRSNEAISRQSGPSHSLLTKRKLPMRPREKFHWEGDALRSREQAQGLRPSYKKRSMMGPSFLIVPAGHSFRSVMIALSRA